ncbi:MAG TPA: PAC2 family protein [Acidimicrobiales bacterium]
MGHTAWERQPTLQSPVVITAFEGWNDAGDAATMAIRHLRDTWGLEKCGAIEAEEFYDFTTNRPHVRRREGRGREIRWPRNWWYSGSVPEGPDVIVLLGTEPALRWRTFCAEVVNTAQQHSATMVVSLGALLADVPHHVPTPVVGAAYDDGVIDRLGLDHSNYEGPTGIVGVLHDACATAGIASASLWAAVPTYVPGAPSPKAALALIDRLADLLELSIERDSLVVGALAYEQQISELVDDDEELAEYVNELIAEHEDRGPGTMPSGNELIADIERFLRDRGA